MTSIRTLIEAACSEDPRSPEERETVESILSEMVAKIAAGWEKVSPMKTREERRAIEGWEPKKKANQEGRPA